jgi:hypothetical protein
MIDMIDRLIARELAVAIAGSNPGSEEAAEVVDLLMAVAEGKVPAPWGEEDDSDRWASVEAPAELRDVATRLWQAYVSFRQAGFNEREGMFLVSEVLK